MIRRSVPQPVKVASVITEVKGQLSFKFYAGDEVHYVIVFCPSEGCFVRILSCC